MAENSPQRALFLGATSVGDIIQIIKSALLKRTPVEYGVRKEQGVSLERSRKAANKAAIEKLQELENLPAGAELTDEDRQVLARYTGEGGIGGSEYEYYTPQHVAAGMWDMMRNYQADTGNVLEPSAGAGIFHEMKPRGVVMTATEISDISGRINQLLHPEDEVKVSAFENLAKNTPNDSFDGVIGNVPFGDSRGAFANLDPEYKDTQNIGHYFVLRTLDKLRPGGLSCLIVPYGMTSGSKHKKFREQVSRKAEFLGAHRLPSGTFEESGTATAVDIWVLRKHPDTLADKILELDAKQAEETQVLWPTFITGKWFEREGKRFQHGEAEMQGSGKFQRLVIKNDQITDNQMRAALAHRFESRIDWDALNVVSPPIGRMVAGEKRFINGKWYRMDGGRLVIDTSINSTGLDAAKYGVEQYEDLRTLTRSPRGLLSLTFEQLMNIAASYPEVLPIEYQRILLFAGKQKPKMRERAFRGSVIGQAIAELQDLMARGATESDYFSDKHNELRELVAGELAKFGSPHAGGRVDLSGEGGGPWLRFKASITPDGQLSELVRGELDRTAGLAFDSARHEDVVRHLFNDISLDPVTLADFRANYTGGDLPEDDDELLAVLAGVDGIAITATDELMPFDRATSGDIGLMNAAIMQALQHTDDERIKANYHAQLETIKEKRKWTDVDSITFKLNSRWMDRRLVLEFLQERGYDELKYVQDVDVEDGKLVSDLAYSGRDGVFVGYRYKTVMQKDKATGETRPVYKRYTPKDPFDAQLESYLNGANYRKTYGPRVAELESDFNDWIRQHDEIDNLTQQYNDAFNAFIPYEHSGTSLGLESISGERTPMDYQNSEVRRVSEDGRGIIGFGTGLGKTTTALALEAYNFETGRTKRTAYVVPKSVLENWYHEARGFYKPEVLNDFLFVGLNVVRDDEGNARQVPQLDENGNPKLGKDGQPLYRDALTLASSAEIKERMNTIPQSNYRAVVMTKEQYAAIPLRVETIDEHAADVMYAMADAGRVNLDGDKHSDAKRRNAIRAKAADTGTAKAEDFPYFEDMGFDSVIVDEGHNYRNSYAAGREAAALAYLPTGAQAKSAKDMAIKNAYLMKKYNGRGPVMLTATPLVNSPIDAFNMLSHVVPMEEWHRMGIHTPDDFVKVFGKTESVMVQKLSGELEQKEGLTGFLNLDGLRGIFHRWTTLKTAKDVSAQVKIPEVKEHNQTVPMTQYQRDTYEELRERAQALSNPNDMMLDENDLPIIQYDSQGNPIDPRQDSIFSIIRDMDRVCTDPDLYHRVITFRFPSEQLDNVKRLFADLPEDVKAEVDELEGEADYSMKPVKTGVELVEGYAEMVVGEDYEQEVMSRLEKFGLSADDLSHPIPPKYSMLIEQIRAGLEKGGKQIVFSDEKSQHNKLRRILAAALPLDIKQIGILNASTVAEAAKGTKKPKKVKRPADLKEDATPEQMQAHFEKQQAYEAYLASLNEISLGGLESIAADYQEGRTKILICNKKAEVGINLHLGTTDMHHLTLPWTPASIDQRNGRGARVGGTQDSVNAHYYCGEGSFDEFRLATLKRKKNWITDILTSDKASMDNADANTQEEMQLLLAADPEERERRRREQEEKLNAIAREKAEKRAKINLTNFIKAKHAAKGNPMELAGAISGHRDRLDVLNAELAGKQGEQADLEAAVRAAAAELADDTARGASSWTISFSKDKLARANRELRDFSEGIDDLRQQIAKIQDTIRKKDRILTRIQKAASQIKRLRPELERAQRDGLIGGDSAMLDHADECYQGAGGRMFRIGRYYEADVARSSYDERTDRAILRMTALDVDSGIATLQMVWSERVDGSLKTVQRKCDSLLMETSFTEDEIELKAWLFGGKRITEIADRLTKEQFRKYLREGTLMIREQYVLHYDKEGITTNKVMNSQSSYSSMNMSFIYGADDWFKSHADSIVYPDPNDQQLKEKLAKAYRQRSYMDLAKAYFITIFGNDYVTQMASYGEQASPSDIAETVAQAYERVLANKESAEYKADGSGTRQQSEYFRAGTTSTQLHSNIGYTFNRDTSWIPGEFTNTRDFQNEMTAYLRTREEETSRNIIRVAKDAAADAYRKYQTELTVAVKDVLQNVDNLKLSLFSRNFLAEAQTLDTHVELFSWGVILGLADTSEISPEAFSNPSVRYAVADRMNVAYAEELLKPKEERWQHQRMEAGLVTQEEIDAAKAKRQQIDEEVAEKEVAREADGITIKQNQTTLLAGRYKNVKMPAGEYWCLQDSAGKGGALFRAKDELKEKYKAFFYNGKNPDDECPGAWWLIKVSSATAEELMAIIGKY
ncbi:SNF2-related protein [Enterobacter hormaechei]